MPSLSAQARLALIVLRAGGRGYTVGDLLATLPPGDNVALTGRDVESAVEDFRYQRDLVSAEECDIWLAQRGLDYSDLVSAIERGVNGHAAEDPVSRDRDALLSARFDAHAIDVARHAALMCELHAAPAEALAEVWPRWQSLVAAHCTQVIGVAERQRELALRADGLVRLQYTEVEFDSPAAAREARLCVEHDGLTLAQIATEQGFPQRSLDALMEDLDAATADGLRHARIGQCPLITSADARIRLLQLHARHVPALEDTQIAARIDSTLRARLLDRLVCAHVHWNWPLHHR